MAWWLRQGQRWSKEVPTGEALTRTEIRARGSGGDRGRRARTRGHGAVGAMEGSASWRKKCPGAFACPRM